MKKKYLILIIVFFVKFLFGQIQLYPENPHYFYYKNKPIVLVGSCEHFGSIINKAFDFETYLNTLKKTGLNYTRIFLGDYREASDAFCIEDNTLNPDSADFVCPWARSSVPGYALGGNKFDLDRWDENYFKRLHQFMTLAEKNDIVVEAVMFFASWTLEYSPLYYKNNINKIDKITAKQYMILNNGNVLARQEKYCRKLVRELNAYDNLIISVANEPWFDNEEHPGFRSLPPKATKQWIKRVSEWIVDTESSLPKKHLLSVDYINEGQVIGQEDLSDYYKYISVFNHHYDRDALSAKLNYSRVKKALSFNETGLMPAQTPQYRIQGWKYLFCGGALYNNLDFSFQVGHEDGSGRSDFSCEWYSGCSDASMKYQLANLLKFFSKMNFSKMEPDLQVVAVYYGDENVYPLAYKGHEYAVYFEGGSRAKIKLHIPDGEWKVRWINPADLKIIYEQKEKSVHNFIEVLGPRYTEDVLLYITR